MGSTRRFAKLLALLFSIMILQFCNGAEVSKTPPKNQFKYAIIASSNTIAQPDWLLVVRALQKKYPNNRLFEFNRDIFEIKKPLAKYFPRYACFVSPPEETGRSFVASAHRLMRQLDDDPYTDAIWGILTGYEPDDALRIARREKPLIARKVLTATVGALLDEYDQGLMFNELEKNIMWEKTADGKIRRKSCPDDTTKAIVDALNNYQPDVFITSGHASEHDWMIGYGYRNGFFHCKNGQLFGLDTQKHRYDVHSPNPKVHLAVGNCLIAHIPQRDCMALALIHSCGVYQMVGYTVPTGFGYGGWGVKDYFSELQAGRFTLAQANYVNNLALVYELEKRGQNDSNPHRLGGGLRGDRDVVVLYGDPAWQVRMPRRKLPWTQTLTQDRETYTFLITANKRGDWDNRPVIELLPRRIRDIRIISGEKYRPVITDNFILVNMRDELLPMKGNRGEKIPLRGDYEKGQTYKIVFRAKPIK